MRIKNRLSPYPILDDYGDDYIDSSFTAEYEVNTQFTEIYGTIKFHLNNTEISKLIEQKKAMYVAHIECPSTCFRDKVCSLEREIDFKLDSTKVSKVLEIRTFIVLTEEIKGFYSTKFHPDYMDQTFDLNAHQILAIGTAMDYNIQHDDKDLESLPSIIKIVKLKDKKKGSFSVNTDNDDYILIGLTDEVYDWYAHLGKSTFKSTSFCLILFPALIIVLQRMRINKDDSEMSNRHWFIVINNMLNKNGFNLESISIENDSLLSICQSMFADPIARSFKELESCSERMV